MAQPTNTFDQYDAIGNREDLSDVIYNISPTETPFISSIGRESVSNVFAEWQTDSLAAVDTTNAVIEGDDVSGDSLAATVRVGNRTQIMDKVMVVSSTQRSVNPAGRSDELAYQTAKKGRELRRDMEAIMTRNQASVTGDASTARKLGSFEAWITTNDARGSGGSDGGFSSGNVTAATDGTQRAITEDLVRGVLQSVWTNGGMDPVLMCGPFNKRKISAFVGKTSATIQQPGEDRTVVGTTDVYISDYGTHRVVANRFSRDRTLMIYDPELWAVGTLQPFQRETLAKTGHSDKVMLFTEVTLISKNEAGSGVLADLLTS